MIDNKLFSENSPQLYTIGKQIHDQYAQELRKVDAVASGTLVNSKWDIELDKNGLKLVFFLPEYWRYIEFGRRPTQNKGNGEVRRRIAEWIKDKGVSIQPRRDKNGRLYTPTEKQLVYMITNKIHKVGYAPRHPLETAMNNSEQLQRQFVDTATKMYVNQVMDDLIIMLNTTK